MMVGMFGWMVGVARGVASLNPLLLHLCLQYIAVKPIQAEVVKGVFLARVPSNSLEQVCTRIRHRVVMVTVVGTWSGGCGHHATQPVPSFGIGPGECDGVMGIPVNL